METLPRELLIKELAWNLDEYSRCSFYFVISSSEQLKQLIGSFQLSLRLPVNYSAQFYEFRPKFIQLFWKKIRHEICHRAVKANNFELLKWARTPKSHYADWLQDIVPIDSETVAAVYETNNTDMSQWLEDNDYEIPVGAPSIAAARGNVEMLAWILSHPTSKWCGICYQAIREGHVNVLEWMLARKKFEAYPGWWYAAAIYGHLHVLQWAYAAGLYTPTPYDFIGAAKSNNPELVRWFESLNLKSYPTVWTSTVISERFPQHVHPTDPDKIQSSVREAMERKDWKAVSSLAVQLTGHHNTRLDFGYIISYVTDTTSLDILVDLLHANVKQISRDIVEYDRVDLISWPRAEFNSSHLCFVRSDNMLDALLQLPFKKVSHHVCQIAFAQCRLDLLQSLDSDGYDVIVHTDSSDIKNIIQSDRMDVLQWLVSKGYVLHASCIRYAVSIPMLRYLYTNDPQQSPGLSTDVTASVARRGWLEGLQWLRSPIDIDDTPKLQIAWDSSTVMAAVQGNHAELLMWMCSPKSYPFEVDDVCPITMNAYHEMVIRKQHRIIEWVTSRRLAIPTLREDS